VQRQPIDDDVLPAHELWNQHFVPEIDILASGAFILDMCFSDSQGKPPTA
jgi:hypothetical protein